jgi:YVTN family beta-propeller protein
VAVIDTTSNGVATTVSVGTNPLGVAITPDGARAYVTNRGSNDVWVIDTASNLVATTVAVGTQ